jgi:hypothetical protein
LVEHRKLCARGKAGWGLGVKTSLDRSGLSFLWEGSYEVGENLKAEIAFVKQRFSDNDLAETSGAMVHSRQLNRYNAFNQSGPFRHEFYSHLSFAQRRPLSLFRLNCVYSLPISKIDVLGDQYYQCRLCKESFMKPKVWSHYLYYC